MTFPLRALTLGALAFGFATAAQAAPPVAVLTGPMIGAPAPDFSLTTLEGKRVSLAQFRGKTLVVNAWATWCPPCRDEMPDFISISRELRSHGVTLLGVDTTEDAPIVRAYVAANAVPYPQAIDANKAFEKAYDVAYFPTTYVIDRSGILRARYIDVIAPKTLRALVIAASSGRSVALASPLQEKIDASLSPDRFTFTGSPQELEANAKAVDAAIASAEKMLDDSDAASGNPTDLLRTRSQEATIRDRAIASLEGDTADAAFVARLRGDAARDREAWREAVDAYRTVLASDPKNVEALQGTARAAGRLEEYRAVVDADTQLVALDPNDVEALVDLARAQARSGDTSAAYATFANAVGIGDAAVAAHPENVHALQLLAWTHLYFGRVYAKAGDAADARGQFGRTLALATKLPVSNSRHAMYLEEAQEALVALNLSNGAATVSLAPWTGAELPGSVPNTIKYRLVVTGSAGKNVALRALDVPKGWVASFCSDRVCAPFRVSVSIPGSGVKIVEFQLVPPSAGARVPKVRVTANDGGRASTATT